MKILTIASTPFFSDRGCHIRIYNEAKYLQKLGAEVEICTYHNGENIEGLKIHRISEVNWYKKTSPGFAWGKLWLDLKLLFLCVKMLRTYNFDIIHAHLFESLAIAKIAKIMAFKKIPIVVDLQGDIEDEFKSYNRKRKIVGRFFYELSKIVFNWADAIVVSSQNAFEIIKQKYKTQKPIEIVGDGIDEELFQKPDPKKYFNNKEELDEIKEWKGTSKLLIYAGGMSDNKGVGEMLDEFISNFERVKDWKLIFYGKGEKKEEYLHKTIQTGQENRFWFARENGYFSLPHYLRLADLAIEPKQNSSESSAKITNYMAAGLPIICFENDFNRKILGEKGFYLNNWKDFSLKLEELNKTDFIEKNNYNLGNFSEKKQVEILLGLFKKVLI